MSEDRRFYQRFTVNCPAQCALLDSFPQTFPVMIVDISPEGIKFIGDEKLKHRTEIYFMVDLGGSESVKFLAQVRWSKREGCSSRFATGVKIFNANKEDLEKFVRFYYSRMVPVERDKKKILVVEDERGMAKLLELELTQNGYDVVCAHDGETGFFKYITEQPDLIILDIMLPKLNGYEVCRRIRREQNDNGTPILMLTAKKDDVDRIIGGVIGAQKYLTKPFEAEHLLSEIKELLSPSKD